MFLKRIHFATVSSMVLGAMQAYAASEYDFVGKGSHRFTTYTQSTKHYAGQDSWIELEQKVKMGSAALLKLRGDGYVGNYRADLIQTQDNINYSTQTSEVWPDDAYFQLALGPLLLKTGYQRISWQEGFALTYTNFINARDYRMNLFDETVLTYRSAPLANAIISGENLSLQLIYLPYSQMDISAPPSRWGTTINSILSSQQTIEVIKPDTAKEMSNEYGGRLTWAGTGFDVSAFYFFLKDRMPIYTLSALSSFQNIKLQTSQNFMTVYGLTSSINWENSVLRIEGIKIPRRQTQTLTGSTLAAVDSGETAATMAFDSPAYGKFNFIAQVSASMLDQELINSIRKKMEYLSLLSLRYDFENEKVLTITGLHHESDHSVQGRAQFSWPYSKGVEMLLGVDFGNAMGLAEALKDMNRVYFQVTHHF